LALAIQGNEQRKVLFSDFHPAFIHGENKVAIGVMDGAAIAALGADKR
jgi:hypothetical protein